MATNTLHIRVRSDGTRVVSKGIKSIGESANVASRQIFLMQRAIKTLFVAAGVRAAFRMVNTFKEMDNKIRTVIRSERALTATRARLVGISNRSRTSMTAIVDLYTRTKRAADNLGKSESELRKFTELLAKETVISGASTIEAEQAIRQLTQGMGPAGLKGEELRSVLEQLPTVAKRIATELGITIGELRKFGEEGKITGETVINAMLNAEKAINERFGKSLVTPTQALAVLNTRITDYVGRVDQALGVSQAFADVVLEMANNIDTVAQVGVPAATAGILLYSSKLRGVIKSFGAFGVLATVLFKINNETRQLTGGQEGLAGALRVVVEQIEDLVTAITNLIGRLAALAKVDFEMPGIIESIDALALDSGLTQRRTQIDTDIVKELMKNSEFSEDLTAAYQRYQVALENRNRRVATPAEPESELAFTLRSFQSGTGAFSQVTTAMSDNITALRNLFEGAALQEILDTQKDSAGVESFAGGAMLESAKKAAAEERRLSVLNDIKLVTQEIQSVADAAGKEYSEASEDIFKAVQQIQSGLDKVTPGEGLKNYKLVAEELQKTLDDVEKNEALGRQSDALQAKITSSLSKLDELREKAKKLPEGQQEAAIAEINKIAEEGDRILKAAFQNTGAALVASYAEIVAKLQAIGSAVQGAAGTRGGNINIENPNDDINNPLGTDTAKKNLDETIQTLEAFDQKLDVIGQNDAFQKQARAAKGFTDSATGSGNELQQAFSSIFGSLEDALVGFVTTGKLDFKSLINSIIADLARMVIRMLIIKPLMGFFGGFFGGIFGFSGGGSVGDAFGLPGFNGGGFVQDNPAVPARFATGGRVHGPGTGVSDSVNALLSRDEFVVNAAASRPNMAGLEYLNSTGRMPGGGNVTSVAYAPNVSITVEGNSDNAAGNGAQIAKDFEQQMRAQFNEFVAQEQRPGGAFSKTNEDVI
jgi:tape measure domain-containing protein